LRVLDIAPESHKGAAGSFTRANVETLDIDAESGATHIADLCECNCRSVSSGCYDLVICTEVLEHTKHPWRAMKEISRLLKPNGLVAITTPFNFRIHGPAPDCWRFTEDGLRVLLENFNAVEINEIEDSDRPRMPIQYTALASKGANGIFECWDLRHAKN